MMYLNLQKVTVPFGRHTFKTCLAGYSLFIPGNTRVTHYFTGDTTWYLQKIFSIFSPLLKNNF